MPLYRYKAVNAAGEVVDRRARRRERERDRRPAARPGADADADRARAGGGATAPRRRRRGARRGGVCSRRKQVTRDQLLAITRELATLLRAGLPLDRALEILIGLAPTPRGRRAAAAASATTCAAARRCRRRSTRGARCSRASTSTSCAPARRAARSAWCCSGSPKRWSATRSCARPSRSALIYPTILIGVAVAVGDACC